jgi:hypothetical protein
LARRKAQIDQMKKQFDDQYPMMQPDTNSRRLEDIEAWEFNIQVHEWELGEIIRTYKESDETQDR